MPDPSVPIRGIPQLEFHGEGVFFDPGSCDHDTIQDGTPEAEATELVVDGSSEDHLLPPHALFPETFSQQLLEAERESSFPKASAHAASNPGEYTGPSYEETRRRSMAKRHELKQELVRLRSDDKAYMKRVIGISWDEYHLDSENILPSNPKMEKGVKYGWTTEGVVFAPNVMAGLGDVCPFSSPLCTAHCLNLSGHAESGGVEGVQLNCRRRRTLMYQHMRDAFMARIASLIGHRQADAKNPYAIRLNVMSDLPWEAIKFYTPWGREYITIPRLFEVENRGRWCVQFYDYTKNCERYQNYLTGNFRPNYHLTFSLSEINALYAMYALAQGGSVTVVFDARAETKSRPAEPLPKRFCGFPVVDGDQTDLRFEDRKRFGISKNGGFVVGLRLKGKKQRREYEHDRSSLAGFVFDAKREYGDGYITELIDSSERRRLSALRSRQSRDLPGAWKQKFVGIPGALVDEAKRELGP
jgi:hypothetical protein